MSAIYRKMNAARWAFAGIIILIACLAATYVAFAQGRKVTLKLAQVCHGTQAYSIEAGDAPGHSLTTGENQGLAIFDNGEHATYKGWWLWDFTLHNSKGQGFGHGYGIYTFEDSSTIVIKFEGTDSENFEAESYSYEEKETITLTGGTGRFKGIKGTGTYIGKHFTP